MRLTTLDHNIQALFHRESDIELDESKAQRQDLVAIAHFQEVLDRFLQPVDVSLDVTLLSGEVV
jgi:hypothetical protein